MIPFLLFAFCDLLQLISHIAIGPLWIFVFSGYNKI